MLREPLQRAINILVSDKFVLMWLKRQKSLVKTLLRKNAIVFSQLKERNFLYSLLDLISVAPQWERYLYDDCKYQDWSTM